MDDASRQSPWDSLSRRKVRARAHHRKTDVDLLVERAMTAVAREIVITSPPGLRAGVLADALMRGVRWADSEAIAALHELGRVRPGPELLEPIVGAFEAWTDNAKRLQAAHVVCSILADGPDQVCPLCHGTGQRRGRPCAACDGQGRP